MSRQFSRPINRRSWRVAVASPVIAASAALIAALLIAAQGQATSASLAFAPFDSGWVIRSGSAKSNLLVLRPAAGSIGLALRPIGSSTFTLQTRVAFAPSQGAAGLIVQADDADHFSAFLISGDGYFRVSDYRNGVWIDRAAWRAWPHIHRDGTPNVLRAECQPDACTLFVNDEWTWHESGMAPTREIGVVANAQSTRDSFEARFDEIGWHP
jgi:hypothetical protein